jgi:hypothetical protein
MSKFLIELTHDPEELACARAVKFFLASGSHLLSHADWGCIDGVHSAWFIVEVDSKDEARLIVPVPFRASARIVALNRWTMEQIDAIIDSHRR